VATLQPPDNGFNFDRFFDALVGGACALVVAMVVLPVDPVRLIRERTRPVLRAMGDAIEQIVGRSRAASRGRRTRRCWPWRGSTRSTT
jgi:uncharacterized membrane protein YgaE (UPF0421/DUF939 family)